MRVSIRRSIGALALTLAGAACVPEFSDDQALLTAPRILAVRSVPAESRVGLAVRLEALVASPDDADGEERLVWALCTARRPLTELGPVAQTCIDDFSKGGEAFVGLGRGAEASATLPGDACRRFGPLPGEADASGASGRPTDPDPSGGYYQPVVVGNEAGTALGAIRLACGVTGVPNAESIRYNQGYRPNENPALDRLDLVSDGVAQTAVPSGDPSALHVRAGARVEVRATWTACPRTPVCGDGLCTAGENQSSCPDDCRTDPKGCTGAETYLAVDGATRTIATRREGLTLSWYATFGHFTEANTGRTESDPDGIDTVNTWTAPSDPGVVKLWTVLRDDRGGVGWAEYALTVDR